MCDELVLVKNKKALERSHLFADFFCVVLRMCNCGEHQSTTYVSCLLCVSLYLIPEYIFTSYKSFHIDLFIIPVPSI